MSIASINSYLRRLRVIFNFGVTSGTLSSNPAKSISFKRSDKGDPKPYLTKEEIDRIILTGIFNSRFEGTEDIGPSYYDEDGFPSIIMPLKPDIYWVFMLGIFAGLRLNEIVNARWEWINPPRSFESGGSITVQSGYQFRVKARQARTISLHTRLRHLLYFKEQFGPTGFIVKPHTIQWVSTSYRWDCRKQFETVLRRADLLTVNRHGKPQTVTPHILRHTFCSMLAQAGYNAYEIQKLAGHSDLKVSESYMHLAPHEKGLDW